MPSHTGEAHNTPDSNLSVLTGIASSQENTPVVSNGVDENYDRVTHLLNHGDTPKKRKKKRTKKNTKPSPLVTEQPDDQNQKPPVLCISRNKHWRYISSYHGPWLQLPVELLESLLMLNLDPTTFASTDPRAPSVHHSSGPKNSYRSRNGTSASETTDTPLLSPVTSATLQPFPLPPNQAIPPPIDPGVFRSVATIRRLIDEASDLAVRAVSGISAAALGSIRSGGGPHSFNGNNPWLTSPTLGFNPLGEQGGNGRNVAMSATRIHRLRTLAVNRLAAAYKADEIAASVMVMQGASALDDVAERVLKVDPNNLDARYVHFFHEKIPSRQLAECTTTTVLDELIAAQPQSLEYYRTRGVVRCFRDEYQLAIKDFTYALKEARAVRKAKQAHNTAAGGHQEYRSLKVRKNRKPQSNKINGQAPSSGTATLPEEAKDDDPPPMHPSLLPSAPDAIEPQLLFLRGAAYLQSAIYQIENSILELECVSKAHSAEGAELRLCYIEDGKYGGVEIGNPDGPLGNTSGPKAMAYRKVLDVPEYRENIAALLRKGVRDHEKFLSHFDTLGSGIPSSPRSEAESAEAAFLISELSRSGASASLAHADTPPSSFTTYHPLLVESHFSILLCLILLGDFPTLLSAFSRAATLIDGLEGYPIFLPARSMAQAEFIEVMERLCSGWRPGAVSENPNDCHRTIQNAPPIGAEDNGPLELTTTMSSLRLSYEHESDLIQALEALRTLLAPVAKRQRERAEHSLNGEKKKTPINIPLHGPRVEIILAWLGATHLPDLEKIA